MGQDYMVANEALYTVQLGLYVIGYREAQDDQVVEVFSLADISRRLPKATRAVDSAFSIIPDRPFSVSDDLRW
uniref:F54D1.6-like second Ig-like domain-containing protein n=1 Tax=Parascaris equorum TaxID=6256 RepID=A0A914RDA1_PAREQ